MHSLLHIGKPRLFVSQPKTICGIVQDKLNPVFGVRIDSRVYVHSFMHIFFLSFLPCGKPEVLVNRLVLSCIIVLFQIEYIFNNIFLK